MTLCLKLRQSNNEEAEYDDRATWAIHVACFHHSCFDKGVWRCLLADVVIGNAPLFFSAQGSVVSTAREKEEKIDGIAGTRYLNDTPSGCG